MKAQDFLQGESEKNSWSHAYLFIGPDREKIDSLLDFIKKKRGYASESISLVEPAEGSGKSGEIKIDQIRELIHTLNLTSGQSGRLAIIYGCEKLNQSSGNILLKTLEEPPPNVMIILVAQNETILDTIRSRCRIIRVVGDQLESSAGERVVRLVGESFAQMTKSIDTIIKENQAEELLDETEAYLRLALHRHQMLKIVALLKENQQARRDIRNNANAKLVLENLMIKVGRACID